jgi:hypothetical protein
VAFPRAVFDGRSVAAVVPLQNQANLPHRKFLQVFSSKPPLETKTVPV